MFRSALAAVITLGLVAGGARAQEQPPIPAHSDAAAPLTLLVVDGDATLTRDGQAETPTSSMPLLEGDRLRTSTGRLQVDWPEGHSLFVDADTVVDLLTAESLRVVSGRVRLAVAEAASPPSSSLRLEAGLASVIVREPGDYAVEVRSAPAETLVIARAGSLTVQAEQGSMPLAAGERVRVRSSRPGYPERVDDPDQSSFDRWVGDRLEQRQPTMTASYMPENLRGYSATLERYGQWVSESPYGYVWYPSVAATWSPYAQGQWRRVGRFGWTWIGLDAWAWPTHHFGRWGFGGRGWFWIPAAAWSPAWVSWAVGPGYIGWSPLGFNDRPVFGFDVFLTRGLGWRPSGSFRRFGTGRDVWRAWTVVPSARFRDRAPAWQHAVDPQAIPRADLGAFMTTRRPPARSPGTIQLPRGAVPRMPSDATRGVAVPRYSPSIPETRRGADRATQPPVVGPGDRWQRRAPSADIDPYERARPFMRREPARAPRPGAIDGRPPDARSPAPAEPPLSPWYQREPPRRVSPPPRDPRPDGGAAVPRRAPAAGANPDRGAAGSGARGRPDGGGGARPPHSGAGASGAAPRSAPGAAVSRRPPADR